MASLVACRRIVSQAWRLGLDLLLPPRCLTCDMDVAAPGQMCATCFRGTAFVTEPCCLHCGMPFRHAAQGGRSMMCDPCQQDPPPWRQARAALCYDDQARRILLPLKHGDRLELAEGLARHMVRAGAALLRDADVLVPVPLHRSRLRARRYNQSALLAQAVGRLAARPVAVDGLVRMRPTPSLAGKTRRERAATVAGSVVLRPGRVADIADRRVVLVDDVLTTGVTAAACTTALLAGGAARVDVLVGARVLFDDTLS